MDLQTVYILLLDFYWAHTQIMHYLDSSSPFNSPCQPCSGRSHGSKAFSCCHHTILHHFRFHAVLEKTTKQSKLPSTTTLEPSVLLHKQRIYKIYRYRMYTFESRTCLIEPADLKIQGLRFCFVDLGCMTNPTLGCDRERSAP